MLYTGYACISDMGLCKHADYNALENNIYGQNYTKAADVYSFGIIMYEVISGLPPYHDQVRETDEINNELQTSNNVSSINLSYETHSEAFYSSRLLNTNNLTEPKNSNGYYEQLFDFTQLKINDDQNNKSKVADKI
ncbi:hypothetical protein C1645_829607 [Glomus cerebriforme]|uniref:Protein kinase domain-containing protein n=1 Tax=Glomus cerebriforme TaxID=658196 RepID=A0A397SNN4_9GLOM|nr:hypothetical protein C1645_829607 [Glomus cerebriforme]